MIVLNCCLFRFLAENVAEAYNISRHEQDEYASQSRVKCEQALGLGHFDSEIEPIIISTGKSKRIGVLLCITIFLTFIDEIEIRHDECPRKGISIDCLSKMNTIFKEGKNISRNN